MTTGTSVENAGSATTFAVLSQAVRHRNLFPFPILWFSLVALEVSLLAGVRIADQDIWFHLRNAQELLARHSFLRADFYTFTTAGAPLVNYEWLSELPYYLAFQAAGLRGLVAVQLVL